MKISKPKSKKAHTLDVLHGGKNGKPDLFHPLPRCRTIAGPLPDRCRTVAPAIWFDGAQRSISLISDLDSGVMPLGRRHVGP